MAVLPIHTFPQAILRQKAKKIRKIDGPVQRLADDMIDTLRDAQGVGLAANQVGELRRIIVIQLPDEEDARVYVNPQILRREGEREVIEGCLSVPGYHAFITRSLRVRARALDRSSTLVRLRAEGLLAQILEHEIDHLNGILYMDHLKEHEQLIENTPEFEATSAEVAVG